MQQIIENISYRFIPHKVSNIDKTMKVKKTMENDIYEKYEATAIVDGELIICKDVTKLKQKVKRLVQEDYQTYLQV